MKSVSLNLIASTAEDMLRLGTRMRTLFHIVKDSRRIDVEAIDLYFDGPQALNRGYGDEIARMITELKTLNPPRLHLGANGALTRSAWEGFEIV